VISADGVHYLADSHIEGIDPLALFSPHAADHLRRTDSFPHVADIMVNSLYNPDTGEVAAFEELIGSHGGLGGGQSFPFILYPAAWELDKEPIVGAAALHDQLISWRERYSAAPARGHGQVVEPAH
jgi:putative membrane protein